MQETIQNITLISSKTKFEKKFNGVNKIVYKKVKRNFQLVGYLINQIILKCDIIAMTLFFFVSLVK